MSQLTEQQVRAPERELHLGWALVLISVAQLMVVLDGTIVNIALPYIKADLGISSANLTWVVTGYALAAACCCWAVASATSTAAGGSSSWAWWSSPWRPAWAVWRPARPRCSPPEGCRVWAPRSLRPRHSP